LLLPLDLLLSTLASAHALLTKRDPRAMIGWVAACFLTPFVGSVLYYLFGINRVQTRARRLAARSPFATATPAPDHPATPLDADIRRLAGIAAHISEQPLVGGNRVDCLHDGEQAYPAMLEAIEQARHSVFLTSYIFDTGSVGQRFIEVLATARERGLDVRVLVDGIGELGSRPRASSMLARRRLQVARFIPPRLIPPQLSINLRNHRKILVVDGQTAFTGGMNISHLHLIADTSNPRRVTDLHFRLQGPVVEQIQQAFLEDWGFVTGDREPTPEPDPPASGSAFCRTIVDGPNEDLDKMIEVMIAVICAARHRIGIMTPYFLPPAELLSALRAAALRGVDVALLLPEKPDHAFINWGARHVLDLLLRDRVWVGLRSPPFAHSKLLLIDDAYTLLGSANLDPRSLRLNFELGVEVYDRDVAWAMWRHFESVRLRCRPLDQAALSGRSLPIRLRDALAWSCSPYL
jgi:cardiolipin synthase